MKLAIISHTEHYIDSDGQIRGWGPTIREINHLAPHFEKIFHVAWLHKGVPPPSSLRYTSDNIEFIPIPPSGGNNFIAKLSVLQTMPEVLKTVTKVISQVDYFQLRLPTGFGNYLLPWLSIFRPKAKLWVKYAGNWAQKNPPPGYAFQKWFLKNNFLKCNVTINGRWANQPEHCLSFENPCITEDERVEGKKALKSKNYNGMLDFVFVGSLTEAKGVGLIIAAFKQLKNDPRVGILRLVGDGPERGKYEKVASESGLNCRFYGFLPREEVNKVLSLSHVLLLPSASEGFPKVIAEGANYGCIPIVSDVSSIPQYVKDKFNGFVISSLDTEGLVQSIRELLETDELVLKKIACNAYNMGEKFTYSYYLNRIKEEIINSSI